MAYLKERLQEGRRYTGEFDPIVDARAGLSDDWPSFLSGYITAEGYLGILRNAPRVLQPRLIVRVRRDDEPLLTELRTRTGTGRIYLDRTKRPNPAAQWMVCATDELVELVDLLDRHPPKGRKRREYEIWREAVFEYACARTARLIYDRLDSLRRALVDARAYRPAIPT